jgi:hypothetical protein
MLGMRVTKTKITDVKGDRGRGAVTEGTDEALLDAARAGFAKSQELCPVDRGELLMSGVPPHEVEDGSVVWGYDAPHAPYVEYGTVPHWAPIAPLKRWARRVLGDEGAAYAVQQKIAAEGTDPQPFIRPGVEAGKRLLRRAGVMDTARQKMHQRVGP